VILTTLFMIVSFDLELIKIDFSHYIKNGLKHEMLGLGETRLA
jgi:hypothetical protein